MRQNYCVFLYKSRKFYNAFGDDGRILHKLLGYKFIKHKQSVGFPESAFSKVKVKLEEEKISYKVYEKDELVEEYKGIQKNYAGFLKAALESGEIEQRIDYLKSIVDRCSVEELELILEIIENGCYKQR